VLFKWKCQIREFHARGIERGEVLKVGLGISRPNADSQWNLVYNAFHPNFCCAYETIRR